MPDITMCQGKNCPLKETCYRHTVQPKIFWQSYFLESPYKDGECEYYWNNESEKDENRKD